MNAIRHVLIRGRVQGVGFRAWVQWSALDRGLEGWVRNRRDGSVEAVFCGEASVVSEMVGTCRRGPSGAWVDAMDDWTTYYQISDDVSVRDVMTKNPEVARTYDRIHKAVKILLEQRYGALPVVNKKGELCGILSAHDLLGALESLLDASR